MAFVVFFILLSTSCFSRIKRDSSLFGSWEIRGWSVKDQFILVWALVRSYPN